VVVYSVRSPRDRRGSTPLSQRWRCHCGRGARANERDGDRRGDDDLQSQGRRAPAGDRFYNVPVDQLLPADEGPAFGDGTGSGSLPIDERSFTIDLRRLEDLSGTEAEMLNRYLTMIQVQRQDFNGRVLTIRKDDLRAIACILGVGVDGATDRLDDLGLSHGE
jgi:hypothetical protein